MSIQAREPAIADETRLPYRVIQGSSVDTYQKKVVYTYGDSPEDWRKAIGNYILFQFGVYDDPRSTPPISLDESGIRYFERQLKLAGLEEPDRPPIRRILDIGCGWGYILKYLAERFPECQRLDGVNVSRRQLEYCAKFHAEQGLSERIDLYLCNAKDIELLPDADEPYDLVIIRGVISHFPDELYETAMRALAGRVRQGGSVIISTTSTTLRRKPIPPIPRTRSTGWPASTARRRGTFAMCSNRAVSPSMTCGSCRPISMSPAG